MGALSATHWLIIALAVLALFGAKRLPDAARGLGRSLRIFKSEIGEIQSDSTTFASPPSGAVPQVSMPAATEQTAIRPVTDSSQGDRNR